MEKSKLYTRGGDAGSTSLVGGQRVAKEDVRLEAYGTVDELNAAVGLLVALLQADDADARLLRHIQNCLFVVGSSLATDIDTTPLHEASRLADGEVTIIERRIDEIDSLLPPLNRFVLPGGCEVAARAHLCRTICRRAERRICALSVEHAVADNVIKYVNRLSDYFFVLARYLNFTAHQPESFWGDE